MAAWHDGVPAMLTPLSLLLLGLAQQRVAALPHLTLSQARTPGSLPLLDKSVLGNFQKQGGSSGTGGASHKSTGVHVDVHHAQIATIQLGTPPQTLTCLLDSGSSDLWLPSRRCIQCHNDRHFNADASSTFEPELIDTDWGQRRPKAVRISYGSGTVVGYSARDDLKFGSVHIPGQAFIIVEDAALPPGRNWDGICGLGWKGIAHVGPTLYERVQQQGRAGVFAITPAAAIGFGGPRRAHHLLISDLPQAVVKPGSLVWVKAEHFDPTGGSFGGERSFWVVSGGVRIQRPKPVPVRFLVDTGTNQVLLVPERHYSSFISSLIPHQLFQSHCGSDPRAGIVCDCSVRQNPGLLPLQIYLGGRPFSLPLSEMFVKVPARGGEELCLLTIQPNANAPSSSAGVGPTLSDILGAIFGGGGGVRVSPEMPHGAPSGAGGGKMPMPVGEFPMPPLPFSLPGMVPGRNEVVEETREYARPDGRICKVTRLIRDNHVVQQSSPHCEPSAQRRLQSFGWPFGEEQQQAPQVDDELWMLGGVFLEHFVTAFDFDHGRLGMGEPSSGGSGKPLFA